MVNYPLCSPLQPPLPFNPDNPYSWAAHHYRGLSSRYLYPYLQFTLIQSSTNFPQTLSLVFFDLSVRLHHWPCSSWNPLFICHYCLNSLSHGTESSFKFRSYTQVLFRFLARLFFPLYLYPLGNYSQSQCCNYFHGTMEDHIPWKEFWPVWLVGFRQVN